MKLTLGNKILLAATGAVLLATLAGVATVYRLSVKNRVGALRSQMSSIIKQSETVASDMDTMYSTKAFDTAGLLKTAHEKSGGRPLKEIYASTALYNTVPIVAAWRSVEGEAQEHGFTFAIPCRPGVPARNPKNNNGAEYADAFKAFEQGQTEYFFEDKVKNELVLARPVKIADSCLTCHGDPATSASGDGRDILGFPMENMKLGDLRGAFVLRAPMTNDPVVASTMKAMTWVGLVVLGIVSLGFFYFNRRFIIAPLSNAIVLIGTASGEVSSAAGEMSGASQSLAEGSSEQAASLEETSASLEEIASMTKRNAQSAQGAKDFSSRTRTNTEASAASTREMGAAMEGIKVASTEMREAMNGIKAASGDVSKIIKTIDEIAFQTNILALNAAVEAARAGEAGMGFAVVADEVRNLAQRSAKAAKETADMIEASIKRSEDGMRVTEKVATAVEDVVVKSHQLEEHLAEILTNVQQVDEQVAQIAVASQEQGNGITQVNVAVSQMDKVTQGTAANAEETASAAEELSAQSHVLRDAVSELQKLVSGSAPETPALHPHAPTKSVTTKAPMRQASAPAARKFTMTKSNGHAAKPSREPSMAATGALPLPDDRDFKDF